MILPALPSEVLFWNRDIGLSRCTPAFRPLVRWKSGIYGILLGMIMPGSNGIEMLKSMKEDERYCEIPVLMMTAVNYAEDEMLSRGGGGFFAETVESCNADLQKWQGQWNVCFDQRTEAAFIWNAWIFEIILQKLNREARFVWELLAFFVRF